MGENFAFFLPVMMASFGVAFLIVWGWGARAAAFWSAGFFCAAGGFAVPAAAAILPMGWWGPVADLLFGSAFLLYSQALLDRWRPGWLFPLRVAILILSILLCALATALDTVALELVASDFGCFLLITIPLVAGKDHLRRVHDRALYGASLLVALDNLVRGSTVPLTLDAAFGESSYAFLMQAMACMFGLFLALAALAANMRDVLSRYRRDAHVDPLSGLFNRRGFEEGVARLRRRGQREGSLILCDIDHFKAVNDDFGHALGDRVIVALADTLHAIAPRDALTARFGGEEFVLLLPGMDAARAAGIANGVREHFTDLVARRFALPRPLTASFGLSILLRSDPTIEDALVRADLALYEAKTLGRNRVCVRRALDTADAQTGARVRHA